MGKWLATKKNHDNKGDSMNDLTIETITPPEATHYLTKNVSNRKIRPNRVGQYAAEMKAGCWYFTGDPIVFDWNDRLLQGQHRLSACVMADTPFKSVVLRNADPAIYVALDQVLPRAVGDSLGHAGVTSTSQIAAVTKLLLSWRLGVQTDPNAAQIAVRHRLQVEFAVSNADGLTAANNWARRLKHAIGVNQTALGAFIYEVSDREGDDRLRYFFDGVVAGEGLVRGDPRLAYRNWAASPISQHVQDARIVHLANTIRAWNAMDFGEDLLVMKNWRRGAAFPKLRTLAVAQ